jgi:3-oxoacyl-[acyl-carrier-protein] synthase II
VKNFDPAAAFPSPKEVRRTDRYTQFGVFAAWQALKDSGLDLDKVNRDEVGVFLGSGIGGLYTTQEQTRVLFEKGPGRLSPFMIPMLILNMASGVFSMYYKLRGPNVATCSACATATHALGEAWRTIKMGDASVMFAGGTEATIVPIGIGGFCAMRAMSTRGPSTRIGMALSWAKAQACWCSRNWNTPSPAAPASTRNWSATATPLTRTT